MPALRVCGTSIEAFIMYILNYFVYISWLTNVRDRCLCVCVRCHAVILDFSSLPPFRYSWAHQPGVGRTTHSGRRSTESRNFFVFLFLHLPFCGTCLAFVVHVLLCGLGRPLVGGENKRDVATASGHCFVVSPTHTHTIYETHTDIYICICVYYILRSIILISCTS